MTLPPTAPYPPARRQDLVEQLPAGQPTYAVADPYRWLEDPAADETQAWSKAQDELVVAHLGAIAGLPQLRNRLTELLSAGVVTAPAWRGERQFFMRRTAEQEHAVLYTIDPDGTERALVDPIALDPTGTTTLDAWQPSKEGHLLAYQVSVGGDEESMLQVMDVATGADRRRPDRSLPVLPRGWLPGGEQFYYVRQLPRDAVPADEQQYHRRVWLHRVGTNPADDTLIFGDDFDLTTFFGVSVSMDGRWLVVSASPGTAPRNDLWLADLPASSLEAPTLVEVQVGVDAQTSLHIGRDGRAYVYTDSRCAAWSAGRRRPAGAVSGALDATCCRRTPRRSWRISRSSTDPSSPKPVLLAGWTRHAVSEVTVHDLATGERIGEVPMPGIGSIGGLSERPEGGSQCWFGYTDHTTPSSVLPLRRSNR